MSRTLDEEITLQRFLGYPRTTTPEQRLHRAEQAVRILRIALEAIVGPPDLPLRDAKQVAWLALRDINAWEPE